MFVMVAGRSACGPIGWPCPMQAFPAAAGQGLSPTGFLQQEGNAALVALCLAAGHLPGAAGASCSPLPELAPWCGPYTRVDISA